MRSVCIFFLGKDNYFFAKSYLDLRSCCLEIIKGLNLRGAEISIFMFLSLFVCIIKFKEFKIMGIRIYYTWIGKEFSTVIRERKIV